MRPARTIKTFKSYAAKAQEAVKKQNLAGKTRQRRTAPLWEHVMSPFWAWRFQLRG